MESPRKVQLRPLAVYTQGNWNSKRQVFLNNRYYLHQGIIENNTPKMENQLLTNQMNRNSGIESGFEVNRAFRGKNIFE